MIMIIPQYQKNTAKELWPAIELIQQQFYCGEDLAKVGLEKCSILRLKDLKPQRQYVKSFDHTDLAMSFADKTSCTDLCQAQSLNSVNKVNLSCCVHKLYLTTNYE